MRMGHYTPPEKVGRRFRIRETDGFLGATYDGSHLSLDAAVAYCHLLAAEWPAPRAEDGTYWLKYTVEIRAHGEWKEVEHFTLTMHPAEPTCSAASHEWQCQSVNEAELHEECGYCGAARVTKKTRNLTSGKYAASISYPKRLPGKGTA